MKEILIEIKNLSKQFPSPKEGGQPVYALNHLSLSLPRGCIYGIIGMSGAGKSTLLRCLTGLDIPSEGTVTFEGREFPYTNGQALQLFRKQMGMVFQHFQLFSSRTVGQNVAYPLEISGFTPSECEERVKEVLELVGLESKKDYHPCSLSGGEKQRAGIARALASHPSLLLCDEPTSALDPKTTRDLLQLLRTLHQHLGLTIVIITHQLEIVKQTCERVAVLADGQIVEEGEVKTIFTQPQHPITRHLLHADAEEIPEDFLKQHSPEKRRVRLGFEGMQAKEPMLSHMIKRYDVEANILSGGLESLQGTIVGHLFVELSGTAEEIERALTFLRHQHIICEEFP